MYVPYDGEIDSEEMASARAARSILSPLLQRQRQCQRQTPLPLCYLQASRCFTVGTKLFVGGSGLCVITLRSDTPTNSILEIGPQKVKLKMKGLSGQTDEDQLRDAFSSFGEVTEARIVIDVESGKSKGFAFIRFASASHADIAMKTMNGRDLNGRTLRVGLATEKPRVYGGTGYDGRYSDGGDYGSGGDGGFGYR